MPVSDLSFMAAKVEATYGTWAAPTPAADAAIIFGYEITPMESEQVRRQTERGFSGGNPSIPTAIRQRHSFSLELTGAGTATGVAHWAKFLRGCQFAAASPGASDCTYPLIGSGDGASLSLAGNKGNVADARGKGSRGNAIFRLTEKQLPSIGLEMMSLLQDDVNIITPNVPAGIVLPVYPAPVEVNLLNSVIQLGGFTLGVRSFELNMGNKTEFFSTTATREIIFGKDESGTGRAPTARLVAELPDPAVKNFFPQSRSGEAVAFSLTHGTVAGNIIELTSANAVLSAISFSQEANRLFMNADLAFVATSAGNDFTLKTK